ncbi:hypothetical protein B0H12DRAFT_378436 [Mycena haematopus]|nr:hypothetical protein B0H12DRAFT_378436 [Mycena haematopus]
MVMGTLWLLGLTIVLAVLIGPNLAEGAAQTRWQSRRKTDTRAVSFTFSPATMISPVDFAGCDTSQKSQLRQAFKDAGNLASKGTNFDINLAASMDFFGAPPFLDGGSRTIIQGNFARAAAYQPRWDDWLRISYINLTCNDPAELCGPTTFAYRVDPEPRPYPLLNFCPPFFEQRSLEEAVEYAMADERRRYDLRSYDRNQGLIFLHEILHMDAVGQSQITDILNTTYDGREYGPAIGPLRCKYLAFSNERNNVVDTVRNADSYVQWAMGSVFLSFSR